MKILLVGIILLPFVLVAQTNDMGLILPPDMLDTNVRDWQLNGVTLLLLIQVLGRVWSALRKGGGLVGIWKGIVFGENVPKEVAAMMPEPPTP